MQGMARRAAAARTDRLDQGSAAAMGSDGSTGSGGTDSGLKRRLRLGQWKLRHAALTTVLC